MVVIIDAHIYQNLHAWWIALVTYYIVYGLLFCSICAYSEQEPAIYAPATNRHRFLLTL